MAISRRQVMQISGATLAGLAMGVKPDLVLAQAQTASPTPDHLVETPLRDLPLLALKPDGSAKEFTAKDVIPITDPPMWRYTKGQAPEGETDYRKLKIKIDGRGMTKLSGTLTFEDLSRLPKHSQIVLLQCGVPNPRGIVKWTGVRFSDVVKMLGVQPLAHYCRFVGSDRYYTDEDMKTVMHPQTMLVWMMNDEPLPASHGAPIRLVMPFRYGARSMKAVKEIAFGSPGLPTPPLPG